MPSADGQGPWDFTAALQLINRSVSEVDRDQAAEDRSNFLPEVKDHGSPNGKGRKVPPRSLRKRSSTGTLGNFDMLWTFLGQPHDSPPPNDTIQLNESQQTDEETVLKDRWRVKASNLGHSDLAQSEPLKPISGPKETRKAHPGKNKPGTGTKQQAKTSKNESQSTEEYERVCGKQRRLIIREILDDSEGSSNKVQRSLQPTSDGHEKDHVKTRPQASLAGHGSSNGFARSQPLAVSTSDAPMYQPKQVGSLMEASSQKERLVQHLSREFGGDRPTLHNLAATKNPPATLNQPAAGIHVFVDMSNILIGFHDVLKANRGMNKRMRFGRKTLSFHNLSLILERGRTTAKRVLVGSDDVDSVQEAHRLGYEISILQRVSKASKRMILNQKPARSGIAVVCSESDSVTRARSKKKVEQAVDEVLHLKILESILDTPTPSTIVLASGDAAQAEYSEGFLKMLERALLRKWRVELVAFRSNMSGTYRSPEWTSRWGSAFSIIELDSFAELLLLL